MYKDKTEDDENADKSENTEETLEDEVNENDIKTKNVEESFEPVEVDIAAWRKIRRRDKCLGLSKMFAVIGYCLTNKLREQRFCLVSIAHKLLCKHNGH